MQATYESISYDDLVTYAVYLLTADNCGHATFEDIVATAYRLFPKKFSLNGYPQWPDSAVVDKSWLRARTDKKYMVGSVRTGFQLTQRGFDVAKRVERELVVKPKKDSQKLQTELHTISGRLIRHIEISKLFRRFLGTGSVDHMSEADLCELLILLPDASPRKLSANLAQFQDAAMLYQRVEIQQFLDSLEKKFPYRFSTLLKAGKHQSRSLDSR